MESVARGESPADTIGNNGECSPPPPATKLEHPKADLAILRRPLLATEFFERSDARDWQSKFIAAELTVDREKRQAVFAELVVSADTPFLKWRAEIGLARTFLAYSDAPAARQAAWRALAAVDEGRLDQRLASDAYFAIAMSVQDRETKIAHLDQAVISDGANFDAHTAILAATAEEVAAGASGRYYDQLLDLQMRSLDFVSGLEDRSLLAEMQLALSQVSGAGTPEATVLAAYVAWLAGRLDDAEALAAKSLEACRPERLAARPGCNRLRALAAAMAAGRSELEGR